MKAFSMSCYANAEDLYKAKAEYYECQIEEAVNLLRFVEASINTDVLIRKDGSIHNKIKKFIKDNDK